MLPLLRSGRSADLSGVAPMNIRPLAVTSGPPRFNAPRRAGAWRPKSRSVARHMDAASGSRQYRDVRPRCAPGWTRATNAVRREDQAPAACQTVRRSSGRLRPAPCTFQCRILARRKQSSIVGKVHRVQCRCVRLRVESHASLIRAAAEIRHYKGCRANWAA